MVSSLNHFHQELLSMVLLKKQVLVRSRFHYIHHIPVESVAGFHLGHSN